MTLTRHRPIRWLCTLLLASSLATVTHAQLNENCTVSILNRTAQVKPDGTWIAINVPANFGQVRARATCVENGITRTGQSALFTIPPNGSVNLSNIQLVTITDPIPGSLALSTPTTTLSTAGVTTQITVTVPQSNLTSRVRSPLYCCHFPHCGHQRRFPTEPRS